MLKEKLDKNWILNLGVEKKTFICRVIIFNWIRADSE